MGVKTAIRSVATPAKTPAKTGNGKAIQRKKAGSIFTTGSVQRKSQTSNWVHDGAQKPVNRRPMIQPKVTVHASDDHFEKEADQVADRVMSGKKQTTPIRFSKVSAGAQRKCASCENEEKKVQALHIQRKCSTCDKEHVQAKHSNEHNSSSERSLSSDSSPPAAAKSETHPLDRALDSQGARGSPLPKEVSTHMEHSMGADFSNVRIHTGQASHEASTAIGARAFTTGTNIHFAAGEFNPSSSSGKHLLAHELAHTVQQGAAPVKAVAENTSGTASRKVAPRLQHDKKLMKIPSPYENKEAAGKHENETFSKKFRNKKTAKLPGHLLKKPHGKKLNKDPVVLPPKEDKKKKAAPPNVEVKANHLQTAKAQLGQLGQMAGRGINFKPEADKKTEDGPAQKAEKSQSKKMSDGVLSKAAASASSIFSFISQVRPNLSAASSAAIAKIKTSEFAQKELIRSTIKKEKAAAKKAMQQAAGSINGYHGKVTAELKAASVKGKMDILLARILNIAAIEQAAVAQFPKIDKAYTDAKADFARAGASVGNECYSRQNQRSWGEFLSKMKHEDDSFLDGPYTDDQKQAKGDAAAKVGDGYKEALTKEGSDQAAKIEEGKPNDYRKVIDAKTEMLKGVNDLYDNALKGIEAAETSGISQADSTKKSMLASVGGQHKAAQAKLDMTEKTQLQMVEVLSVKQSQQIEMQSAQAIDAMEEGGAKSLVGLNSAFKEYKQVSESMNSPPPGMLQQKLVTIESGLGATVSGMKVGFMKGMAQTSAGFHKTAAETVSTMTSSVTESLTEAKTTNAKAIDGLKKLQSAAVTALQGILNNNKKTVTTTASKCVTDIQKVKTDFDSALTKISTDLADGLKTGSKELKKGLQDVVDHGSGGGKNMLDTSIEKENEAAAKVEPRWKSALKILLVIVVTLVIALVVGPAVIGFIGAAVGGGAFGTVVGAVVGGAILGAASSGVITVGNNIIDGKTWHEGVGHAMLEGAVTGAIGGAFGAAGGGIAGKIFGEAAKGIGPALGRFAIQQTLDFGGNIAVEYYSSKMNNQPFSWGNVAQAQAMGAAMHVGMNGLDALKNVKGFKTANKVMESSAKFGEHVGGAVNSKFGGAPKVEVHPGTSKPAVEEPLNKGPSAPKEEPHAGNKPVEENAPAAKPTEEPVAARPKEEPVSTAPKEEPHAPAKSVEEADPSSKPKEEPAAAKPNEEPAPKSQDEPKKKTTEEKKASGLSQDEIDSGIAAKHPTEDGHNMKVTENGRIVKCSTCEMMDFHSNPYKEELSPTKQKELGKEWDAIQKETDPDIKAKKAADFDAKVNAALEAKLSDGANAARKQGLPPAEEGFHWKSNGDGEPIYSNNPNNEGNARVFNKEKGVFEDAGPKTSRKPDIEAEHVKDAKGEVVKESFDTQKEPTAKEAAEVKKAHEERAKAKEDKDKLGKGTDEYNDKNKEMIDHSEKMGEAAADAYMKSKGLEPEYTGSGSRTVDKVYVDKDGKVYVVEAKGGSSDLGTKVSTEGATKGKILEQGSREYLEQTIKEMKASGVKEKIDAAEKIETALKSEDPSKFEYIHVSQKVGPNGELLPATIKKFDIF